MTSNDISYIDLKWQLIYDLKVQLRYDLKRQERLPQETRMVNLGAHSKRYFCYVELMCTKYNTNGQIMTY